MDRMAATEIIIMATMEAATQATTATAPTAGTARNRVRRQVLRAFKVYLHIWHSRLPLMAFLLRG